MNEPNQPLKRRGFLKSATPIATLAMGTPGWRSARAAEADAPAALSQRSIPDAPPRPLIQ